MNTIMKYYSISYHNSWPWKSYFILVISIMWPATNVYKTHHNIIIQHNVLVLCSDANLSTKFFLTTIDCGPLPSILFCSPESQCLWGIYQAWRSSSSHHHEGLCSTTRSPATFKHTVAIDHGMQFYGCWKWVTLYAYVIDLQWQVTPAHYR